jgi:antitoxin component HigA of HigAB toxin-antitoxin module
MTTLTLLEAAHEYVNPFVNKKDPILPCDIEDAYCDGYNAALEYINSLIDRKNESITIEKLNTKIQDWFNLYNYKHDGKLDQSLCVTPILTFIDYINKQSDFSAILGNKIQENDLKKNDQGRTQ